mgnify:CR=1 FL=1
MAKLEIKICGISDSKSCTTAIQYNVDYLGFVFYKKSHRNLTIEQAKHLTSLVPKFVKKVAVLVRPEQEFVKKIKDMFDYLQVYESSPSEIQQLKLTSGKKIIQAIKIKKKSDVELYKQYIGIADEFLFDSSSMEKSSSFNWGYLKNIEIEGWFLAGGININNLEKALKISQKIDISSGLEDNPGKKSIQKVYDFLLKIKKL